MFYTSLFEVQLNHSFSQDDVVLNDFASYFASATVNLLKAEFIVLKHAFVCIVPIGRIGTAELLN